MHRRNLHPHFADPCSSTSDLGSDHKHGNINAEYPSTYPISFRVITSIAFFSQISEKNNLVREIPKLLQTSVIGFP